MHRTITTESRSSAYYDRIADEYDDALETPANRAIRECFWRCTEEVTPAGAKILDFGAGSGLDAGHFASLGHIVTAYDTSEGMLRRLQQRCADQVKSGRVIPVAGIAELAQNGQYDVIISNFAVLSMIEELEPLFRLFGNVTRAGAHLLLSIQNPWNPSEFRTRGFWKAVATRPFTGTMTYFGAELGRTYRHTAGEIRRAASPEFVAVDEPERDCCRTCFGPRSHFRLVRLLRR